MAMPPGNVVISSDKMQFPSNGNNGGEMHNRQWFVDERDRFILWLRGEFAAANAIIDSLCQHLRSVSEPGEYDVLMGCIQQRRGTWNPVLHMQQYFSIAEVTFALQQAAWKKQQQKQFDKVKYVEKEVNVKRSPSQGVGTRQWFRVENKDNQNSAFENHNRDVNVDSKKGQEKMENSEEATQKAEVGKLENNSLAAQEKKDVGSKSSGNLKGLASGNTEAETAKEGTSNLKGSCNDLLKIGTDSIKKQDEEQHLMPIPKTFVGTEILDGKAVNVVEGLKLYGEVFDNSKVSSIVQLANELRSAGRRGQLKGRTFMASKRPMKGRGREVIQLGFPIADVGLEDERFSGNLEDGKVEVIPNLLQDVIETVVSLQVTPVKPDSCIIDFFNEGDHSQPHVCPHAFGRPVCILFLTECEMTFGKIIGAVHPGDYRGSLRLSLLPGSLLSLEGRSADFAKHAIPSVRRQRIFITFTNSKTKVLPTDGQPFLPSAAGPPVPWVPSPNRFPNQSTHVRHPGGPKQFGPTTPTGVLAGPQIHQQHLPPPHNMQPMFIPSPVATAVPYPSPVPMPPVSSGWAPVAHPRHPPPRVLPPGTGVFLPPSGSGSPASAPQSVSANTTSGNFIAVTQAPLENGKGSLRANCNGNEVAGNTKKQESNGTLAGEQLPDDLGNVASEIPSKVK